MIDREHELSITKQAEILKPRQCLLSAASSVLGRPRNHAASRPVASGIPLRGIADAARPAGCRGVQDRSSACEDTDAADGDRGALSPAAHHQARARPQDLSLSAAWPGDHTSEPGLGDVATMQLHCADITYIPMARGFVYLAAVLAGRPVGCCHGGCRSRWKRHSVSRLWRRLWLVTAGPKSSTLIRVRSSPARHSPPCSPATASPSAWTAKGPGGTTCSSSEYEKVYLRAYETVSEARDSIDR
jgi:hypothetical protein